MGTPAQPPPLATRTLLAPTTPRMSVYGRVHEHGAPATRGAVDDDDEWEPDPDFVNDVTEEEQRWGSVVTRYKEVEKDAPLDKIRETVLQEHSKTVDEQYRSKGTFSRG